YFASIGEAEDLAADGDALTPATLTESSETSTVAHSGKAFEITRWAQSGTGDPYAEGSRQILVALKRRLDKALIDAAKSATGWGSYTYDRSAIGDGKITYDSLTETLALFGDETGDLAALALHSKVYKDLLQIKDTTGRPLWVDTSGVGLPKLTALGIPIIVSDRLAAVATVYPGLLLKKGALAAWIDDAALEVLTDVDVLTNADIAAVHMYYVVHRYLRYDGLSKPGVAILKTK
ncbi:MAG: major capsid protein, partial [bacterium]